MSLNAKKDKKENENIQKILITVNEEILEQVKEHSYLGCIFDENGRCIKEVKKRIGVAKTAFWKNKEIL